mmetsp:Transcript_22804/g.58063  ORF Transcript_22804/g.58063 Transcript_22804/m.58063 type:complete len:98 (+) Transcript_22804:96-389(+)|eukprot:CAMPEP_0113887250 /NCGR_PEP_ID=MMETSP0780_2-20120614/12089_1 /TAXON_ID=652834 /ORGANISM="Palpitomonas bilix" /LENGTH=97 /DNA_ID=CAMNT_0000875721 /DNA_START=33 /DNA_END=326 /DNA_ORIENTATION=+ /assembly_acc=CAM_ASM_000599
MSFAECGGGSGVDERLMRKEDGGPKVKLTLNLPNGQTAEEDVSPQATVAFVKDILEKKHDLVYAENKLVYEGRVMPDPMCLVDFGISGSCVIKVEKI